MKLTRQEILKLAVSIMYRGLCIDLIGAAFFFVVGQLVRSSELLTPVEPEALSLLGYSLVAVSAIEIFMVVILKKKWINKESPSLRLIKNRNAFYRHLRLLFMILYIVALTPSLYGFLFFILGGSEDIFMVMLAITLVGYMLVRIRLDDLEKAIGNFDLEDPG